MGTPILAPHELSMTPLLPSPGTARRTAMRTSEVFVLGVITGAVVVWLWGREIEDYVGDKTRGVRAQAAEGLRAVEEKTATMLDHGGDALRRAEEFVQDTKEHVSGALRAGQDSIRPAPATGRA
jgi:hypothetical protein